MIPANQIIHLSKQAFWDINMEKMDYEKSADYIIRKVFEYGSWNDILEVTSFYGMAKIKEALTKATYLRENTLYFASLFLDIPRSKFACYTTKQFHPVQ